MIKNFNPPFAKKHQQDKISSAKKSFFKEEVSSARIAIYEKNATSIIEQLQDSPKKKIKKDLTNRLEGIYLNILKMQKDPIFQNSKENMTGAKKVLWMLKPHLKNIVINLKEDEKEVSQVLEEQSNASH